MRQIESAAYQPPLRAGSGQQHRLAQERARRLAIVVAGDGEDRAAALEEGVERLPQMVQRIAHALLVDRLVAKQIAGDQENIDALFSAELRDALDSAAQVRCAIDAAQTIFEMPVRRVKDSHSRIIPGACVRGDVPVYLRWRILARIRRFLRPTLRRPLPRRRAAI
jgi:hypothetical protein